MTFGHKGLKLNMFIALTTDEYLLTNDQFVHGHKFIHLREGGGGIRDE